MSIYNKSIEDIKKTIRLILTKHLNHYIKQIRIESIYNISKLVD